MARCNVCNKKQKITKSGRHRQTSNVAKRGSMGLKGVKTSIKRKPNVRKLKIDIAEGGKTSVKICMSCYKKYRKDEGFKQKVISASC